MFGTPTYRSWAGMIQRCTNPKSAKYKDYGGRGIIVCPEWRTSFSAFLADMGIKPDDKTLDREDVNGNYEPGNCRWATASEQQTNKRNVPLYTLGGVSKSVSGWAKEYNLDTRTLHKRLQYLGWSLERALNTPHCKKES